MKLIDLLKFIRNQVHAKALKLLNYEEDETEPFGVKAEFEKSDVDSIKFCGPAILIKFPLHSNTDINTNILSTLCNEISDVPLKYVLTIHSGYAGDKPKCVKRLCCYITLSKKDSNIDAFY